MSGQVRITEASRIQRLTWTCEGKTRVELQPACVSGFRSLETEAASDYIIHGNLPAMASVADPINLCYEIICTAGTPC